MEAAVIARLLRKNELLVAGLYLECARLFPQCRSDFEKLSAEEEFHAAVLSDVISSIEAFPGDWHVNKVTSQTLELLNHNLGEALENIAAGRSASRYAITVLKSFEQSMTEMAVSKILISSMNKQSEILSVIDDSFSGHYKRLVDLERKIFGENQVDELFKF